MDMTQVWQERCSKFTFEDAKSAFRMNFAGMKFEDCLKKLEEEGEEDA